MDQCHEYGSVTVCEDIPLSFPPQHQEMQPGLEYIIQPQPVSERAQCGRKLENKAAIITGGDSGIGRAIAYDYVKEGASVAIIYYNEERDARDTQERICQLGGDCLLMQGDLKDFRFVRNCVERILDRFGKIDILVNNHAVQFIQHSILDISPEQLHLIFQNNVISYFYMMQAVLP